MGALEGMARREENPVAYFDAGGVKLYYQERGAGEVIVFVHEFAGDCRSW